MLSLCPRMTQNSGSKGKEEALERQRIGDMKGRYYVLQTTKPRNFPHPFHENTTKKVTVDKQKFEIGFKMEKCF